MQVSHFTYVGLSPPQLILSCAIVATENYTATISLVLSPNFSSQQSVERYQVSVYPDPSSCSSDQVSPSEVYDCSRLTLATLYSITVAAITFRGLEGDELSLSVCLKGSCVMLSTL